MLEDPGGHLAPACILVCAVLRAVPALVLPGLEAAQELEDRLRSLEAEPVLGLECRNLTHDRPLRFTRFHLPGQEVDAELREPFSNGRRVWAPLGLIQGQHQSRSSRSSANCTAS